MIFYWLALVMGEEVVPEGLRRAVQWLVAFFCTNDGLLTSLWTAHLQVVINVLTGMFDMVGIKTNVKKTVDMVCQTYQMASEHLEVTNERRMAGV